MWGKSRRNYYEQGEDDVRGGSENSGSDLEDQYKEAFTARQAAVERLNVASQFVLEQFASAVASKPDDTEIVDKASQLRFNDLSKHEKRVVLKRKHPEWKLVLKNALKCLRFGAPLCTVDSRNLPDLHPKVRRYLDVVVHLTSALAQECVLYLAFKAAGADLTGHPLIAALHQTLEAFNRIRKHTDAELVIEAALEAAETAGRRKTNDAKLEESWGEGNEDSGYESAVSVDVSEPANIVGSIDGDSCSVRNEAPSVEQSQPPPPLSRKERVEALLAERRNEQSAGLAAVSRKQREILAKQIRQATQALKVGSSETRFGGKNADITTFAALARERMLSGGSMDDIDDARLPDATVGALASAQPGRSFQRIRNAAESLEAEKRPLSVKADTLVKARQPRRATTVQTAPELSDADYDYDLVGGSNKRKGPISSMMSDAQEAKRKRRAERFVQHEAERAAKAQQRQQPVDERREDSRRKTSRVILRNKGLTRFRKKCEGNARVHNRLKYQHQLRKMTGRTQKMRQPTDKYNGERSLHGNVVRSRALN